MQSHKILAQTLNAKELNVPTNTNIIDILGIVYFVAGIIAVIVIIIAGFTYTTSGGDAGAVKKAKNMILYSVVGIVVIAMAFVITQFIAGRFS